MKEFFLTTIDNQKIAVNHFNNTRDEVVIIAPGWHMTKDAKAFKSMSEDFFKYYDVITMDFRGHGKSSGWFTFSSKEYLDLEAVINYAKEKYSKVNLIGFSLGAATSIIYTAKHRNIDSLIAVSAPVCFEKIENHFWKKEAYLSTLKKFSLAKTLSIRPGFIFSKKIKPIDIINDMKSIPILLLAGEKDPTIYSWHAEKLFKHSNGLKELIIFKDTYHAEDLYLSKPDKFIHDCCDWFYRSKYLKLDSHKTKEQDLINV